MMLLYAYMHATVCHGDSWMANAVTECILERRAVCWTW